MLKGLYRNLDEWGPNIEIKSYETAMVENLDEFFLGNTD